VEQAAPRAGSVSILGNWMELFLNLLWLAVALAGVGVWWTRWSRSARARGGRRESLRGAVGLSCVLVLLFFAISLTDDLHAVPAVDEDARSTRRAVQSYKGGQTDPDPDKQTVFFAEAASPAVFAPGSVVIARLSPPDSPSPWTAPNPPVGGRAPPSPSSLAL
jgi:hypothetical protein